MPTESPTIADIAAASAAAAQLPTIKQIELPDGQVLHVKRLSWLKFEAVWADIAGILGAIAAVPENATPEQFAQALSDAPGLILKLCALCTELTEPQLAALAYDTVLLVAAEALALNFLDSAGVRRFFGVAGRLPDAMRS